LILHELDKSIRDLVSLSEKSFHFFANPKVNKKNTGMSAGDPMTNVALSETG